MGNWVWLCWLYFVDCIVMFWEFWFDFFGIVFIMYGCFFLVEFVCDGLVVVVSVIGDEDDFWLVDYFVDIVDYWCFFGFCVLQIWCVDDLYFVFEVVVNVCWVYWVSVFLIFGGFVYENFEIIELFCDGVVYWFFVELFEIEDF